MREPLTTYPATFADKAEIVAALERYYAAPVKLTLGKLRVTLKAIAELIITSHGGSPSVAEIARVVRDLGLENLPLATIAQLVEAARPVAGDDVLAAFTLKQLEDLLSRVGRS